MKLKTISDIKTLKNKRVLLRCDFNVPLKIKGQKIRLQENYKIDVSLPTIKELVKRGAIVIIASHLGRPTPRNKKDYSLLPIAHYLSQKLYAHLDFIEDPFSKDFSAALKKFQPGQICLLEKLRFYSGEEKNSPAFAKKLSSLAEIYVNDSFASSHRAHASIAEITNHLPSYAGLNLEKEIKTLNHILKNPPPHSIAIIGGVKISTKIAVIENLAKKFEHILIGGALANNFFKAIGYDIGLSIFDKDYVKPALDLLNNDFIGRKIILPFDVRVASGKKLPRHSDWRHLSEVEPDEYILDIGPRTSNLYTKLIRQAKLLVWNGPMGYYENKHFCHGTCNLAQAVARSRAETVVGGGETIDALNRLHLSKKINFISTGGGAMLEFLAGKTLPGLKPLFERFK